MKWEYCFIILNRNSTNKFTVDAYSELPEGYTIRQEYSSKLDFFNYMGQDSWELSLIDLGVYTFKRTISKD